MAGGILAAFLAGRNNPGFVHNGPLAGLVAGGLFVYLFTIMHNRWKIDDVLGVWPLHGVCGAWGGIAAGTFGSKALGGVGGVAFGSQVAGALLGIAIACVGGAIVYGGLKATVGLRLDAHEEANGADLTILHKISATPDREYDSARRQSLSDTSPSDDISHLPP